MSACKIFTNANHEIKAVNYTDDSTLTEYTIDREAVFGPGVSDAFIMGYRYQPITNDQGVVQSVVVSPYKDLDVLHGFNKAKEEAFPGEFIIVNHSTLDQVKAFHMKALNRIGQSMIYKGFSYPSPEGEPQQFSLTEQDQANITNLNLLCKGGISFVPYHANGQSCRMFTAEEMMGLAEKASKFVTFHITRMNALHQLVMEATNKKDVLAIQYNTPLDVARSATIDEIYTALGITGALLEEFNETIPDTKTSGEIYSNAPSMIKPGIPDMEPVLQLDAMKVEQDPETKRVTVTVPTKWTDENHFASGNTDTNLSAIFHVLTNDQNTIKETYDTRYVMGYRKTETGSEVYTTVENGQVLSVLLPSETMYNKMNDTYNAAETFYIIANTEPVTTTTKYEDLYTALGIVISQDPSAEPDPDPVVQ